MSNLTFSSCSSYTPSMTSSSSLILIFLYPSHLKSCLRGLKNLYQEFPFSSYFDLWSHSGLQRPHPDDSGPGVNSVRCHLLHQI